MAARYLYEAWTTCTCAFACIITITLILRVGNQPYITSATTRSLAIKSVGWRNKIAAAYQNSEMNCTHTKNRPLESVDVEYKRNIYFSVRTTASNYQERLSVLILTWFQAVHKEDIAIISDDLTTGKSYKNAIRGAGFHLILSTCSHGHERKALCCKTGEEFRSYYKAVENNPRYQWFCHVDDDVYVNVPRLSRLLQKYDPHQPNYIGRWMHEDSSINLTRRRYNHFENKNFSLKTKDFQYATGATYCISHALMTEARKYFEGKAFCQSTNLALYSDDITIGVVIYAILGYHLTNIDHFSNQYDNHKGNTSVSHLKKYITVSYKKNKNQKFVHLLPLKNMFPEDQTRFMSFHCLLYPSISWCK